MRSILDLGGASKLLVLGRQRVEHGVAGNERGRAQGNGQLFAGTVIVADDLCATRRNSDGKQRGRDGRGKTVQSGIDVPPIEASEIQIVFRWDGGGVEGFVMGMAELDVL